MDFSGTKTVLFPWAKRSYGLSNKMFVAAQIAGGFAIAVLLAYSIVKVTSRTILFCNIVINLLWAVHYLLLGAYTGCACSLLFTLMVTVYFSKQLPVPVGNPYSSDIRRRIYPIRRADLGRYVFVAADCDQSDPDGGDVDGQGNRHQGDVYSRRGDVGGV